MPAWQIQTKTARGRQPVYVAWLVVPLSALFRGESDNRSVLVHEITRGNVANIAGSDRVIERVKFVDCFGRAAQTHIRRERTRNGLGTTQGECEAIAQARPGFIQLRLWDWLGGAAL